jgi:hypothetical protein
MPKAFWCKHLLADGSQCTMPRVHGSDLCLSHTEGRPYEAKRVKNQLAANRKRRKEAEEITIMRKEARKRTAVIGKMQSEIASIQAGLVEVNERITACMDGLSAMTQNPPARTGAPVQHEPAAPAIPKSAMTPDMLAAIIALAKAMK